jgi:hypothetical protein
LIFLPLDIEELKLIANYQEIKNIGQHINSIDSLIRILNLDEKKYSELEQKVLVSFDDKLLELIREYEYSILKNKSLIGIWNKGRRFNPLNEKTKNYFKKRRKFLITYSKEKYGKIHESIKKYLEEDSLAITMVQVNFDSLRKREIKLKPSGALNAINDSVAELMFKQIHNTIDSLGNTFLYPAIQIIPIKIQYPEADSILTFKKYKSRSLIYYANLDSLEKEHSGEIPYVGAKLPFKKYLSVIYLIALLCLFILPFYFINYKYREHDLDILERVNSFENIITVLSNKKLSKKISNQLNKWSPLITTLLMPVVSFGFITYLFSGTWPKAICYSVLIIIIYIFWYIFSKNKTIKPWLMKN